MDLINVYDFEAAAKEAMSEMAYDYYASGANDEITLRAGFNGAKNPVPSKYLNALFPAIVENHVTFGGGYKLGTGAFNASVALALESEDTNPGNGSTVPPVESTHGQLNWMLMYSHQF